MELINLLSNMQAIRIECQTLEELISDLIEREKTLGYPKTTVISEKVQNNKIQKSAEKVFNDMQKTIEDFNLQKDNLMELQIEFLQRIKKEIKDPLLQSFLIKRFFQNKPIKKIMSDFGWSRTTIYRKFGKYIFNLKQNGTK